MAAQDRTTNQTEINTLLADNVSGDISAEDVRTTVTNQNDSNFNLATDTLTDVTVPTGSKTTPVDADIFALGDSAASNVFKKFTWSNLKTALGLLYQAILAEGAFVDGDKTKLDGIETGADVTDATNVNAAGATMNTDTDLSSNSYFLDEDTLSSNDATKVASQQSIKAYVDNNTISEVIDDTSPQLGGDLDLNGNGIFYGGEAGATVAIRDVVQLQSDGKFDPADASAEATAKGFVGVAIAASTDTNPVNVQTYGPMGGFTSLTVGAEYYMSETAGAITATKPTTSTSIVRLIGYAIDSSTLFIDIDKTYLENT